MRKVLAAVLLATLVGWDVASIVRFANAHEFAAASSTTIRYREATGVFRGRVTSSKGSCERRRKVKVVKETDSGSKVVGKDRSNRRGRWKVSVPNANGTYSAIVVRREQSYVGHVHICERGRSSTISVDP